MTAAAPIRAKTPSAPAAAQETAAHRKAALLLHALPPADRGWLLAELTEAERAMLERLVAELEELGMPADRGMVEQVLGDAPELATVENREAPSPSADAVARLAAADAAAIVALVRDEPAALVAALLDVADWPWRNAVLRRLGRVRRMEISTSRSPVATREQTAGVDGRVSAPVLRRHLLELVLARLDERHAAARGVRAWLRRTPRLGARR